MDITQIRGLADAIAESDKQRVDALAETLGLRVDWHGSHFRLRRGERRVVGSLGMSRVQLDPLMRTLFGRLWLVARR